MCLCAPLLSCRILLCRKQQSSELHGQEHKINCPVASRKPRRKYSPGGWVEGLCVPSPALQPFRCKYWLDTCLQGLVYLSVFFLFLYFTGVMSRFHLSRFHLSRFHLDCHWEEAYGINISQTYRIMGFQMTTAVLFQKSGSFLSGPLVPTFFACTNEKARFKIDHYSSFPATFASSFFLPSSSGSATNSFLSTNVAIASSSGIAVAASSFKAGCAPARPTKVTERS